jgi:excinuclease ABC subunit C
LADKREQKNLPDKPGVYIMKDVEDTVIYVGKAKSLKKRVRSYFKDDIDSPKTRAQMRHFHHLEYMVTDTEKEALILESNLIKKHMPRYNIRLKDDKRYPYVKVTKEDYPRILITRRVVDDGSYYYGPFTDSGSVKKLVKFLKTLFKIRDCKRMDGPCLNYQIKLCNAPCIGKISKKDYRKQVDKVTLLFEGKYGKIISMLQSNMEEAASNQEFEKAAVIRDQLSSIGEVLERQKMEVTRDLDQDVVAFSSDEKMACVVVFSVRSGKITGKDDFFMSGTQNTSGEKILSAFLKQYYAGPRHVPAEIVLPGEVDDEKLLLEWLSEKRGDEVIFKVPENGVEYRLVRMVAKNAEIILKHQQEVKGALLDLKNYLKIPKLPRRIEGFDISNISGKMAVGSMVVFEDGAPKKSSYRRFKVNTTGPDDYAMMREVLTRRYGRMKREDESEPDLVLVDGGKGQLNIALEVFRSLGIDLPVIGLAKEFEHVFIPNFSSPIILPGSSEALHLLQRVRDEAHRFAVSYHRKLRSQKLEHSLLDEVPGVGIKRKKNLLKHFGSLENLEKASAQEIADVKGISKNLARNIYAHLHKMDGVD